MRFGAVEVEVLQTPEAVAERAAEHTRDAANEAMIKRGRFILALSGGSTPRLYHQALAQRFRDTIDWSKVFIVFSDERAVPPAHKDSNHKMAEETLLSRVPIPPGNVFRVEADDGNNERAAAAYEQRLVEHELLPVDLVILGMGEDGHTASLFPSAKTEAHAPNGVPKSPPGAWVIAAHAPPTSPVAHRVTFSYATLAAARAVLGLITGHSKAPRLKEVLREENELPFKRVLDARHDRTLLLIDQAAASHLVETKST